MEPPQAVAPSSSSVNPLDAAMAVIKQGLANKKAANCGEIIRTALTILLGAARDRCDFNPSTLTDVEKAFKKLLRVAENVDEKQKNTYRSMADNCMKTLGTQKIQRQQTEWCCQAFQGLSFEDPSVVGEAYYTKSKELIDKGLREKRLERPEVLFLGTVQDKLSAEWQKARFLYVFVHTLLVQSYAWQDLLVRAQFIKLGQDGSLDLDLNKIQKLSPEQFAFFVQWRKAMNGGLEALVAFLKETSRDEVFLQSDVKELRRSLEAYSDLIFFETCVSSAYTHLQKFSTINFNFLPSRLQSILSEITQRVPVTNNRAPRGFASLAERTEFFEKQTEVLHLLAQGINDTNFRDHFVLQYGLNQVLPSAERALGIQTDAPAPALEFLLTLSAKELLQKSQAIFAQGISKTTQLSASGIEDLFFKFVYRTSTPQEEPKREAAPLALSQKSPLPSTPEEKRPPRAEPAEHSAKKPASPPAEVPPPKAKEPKKLELDETGILLATRVKDWMQDAPKALVAEPYIHLSQEENELSKLLHTYPIVITRIMRKYCKATLRNGDTHYSCAGVIIPQGQPAIEGYFADCFSKQKLELYHHFFHKKPLNNLIHESAKGKAPLEADLEALQGSDQEAPTQENPVVDSLDMSGRYLITKKLYSVEVEDTKKAIRYVLMFPQGLR